MVKTLEQTRVISSDRSQAAPIERWIAEEAVRFGFTESAVFAIRLALDEALANAIHHGNRDDPHKKVTIAVRIDESQLMVRISDEGVGFKPDAVPDPTREENLERPNGRGVMLMKAYMSDVVFNKKGNEVTLIKRKDCSLPSG